MKKDFYTKEECGLEENKNLFIVNPVIIPEKVVKHWHEKGVISDAKFEAIKNGGIAHISRHWCMMSVYLKAVTTAREIAAAKMIESKV